MWILTAGMRHGNQFENEDLIRWGWPEDVWFHVDKLSSAHVYLRLPKGVMWDAIPEEVLQECCQLVKANSIEGTRCISTQSPFHFLHLSFPFPFPFSLPLSLVSPSNLRA